MLSIWYNHGEPHYRSVLKTFTWRAVATTTTMLLVFIFTGKFALSAGIGAAEVVLKMILYYLHERLWAASMTERESTQYAT